MTQPEHEVEIPKSVADRIKRARILAQNIVDLGSYKWAPASRQIAAACLELCKICDDLQATPKPVEVGRDAVARVITQHYGLIDDNNMSFEIADALAAAGMRVVR